MKYIIPLLSLIIVSASVFGQIQNTTDSHSPGSISSGLYALPKTSTEHTFFRGSTNHFSSVTLRLETIHKKGGKKLLRLEEEQILIIKEGEAKVSIDQGTKTIGPNSVLFLLPGDDGTIEPISSVIRYYRMIYTVINPTDPENILRDVSSFIIDYESLVFNESQKGGVRRYFDTSTAMCPYYEMHMTTLNPGLQSHAPHTHEAEEIVLMIEGETEEQIGDVFYRGRKGDVYFTGSNVPHAIRNIGEKPCRYFAFQWRTK